MSRKGEIIIRDYSEAGLMTLIYLFKISQHLTIKKTIIALVTNSD